MEPVKSESKKIAVKNKSKSIKVNYGQDELYTVDFINEVSKLSIVAKTSSDILSLIYTNKFSLEDIQKTKYFNGYESIDDCLEEIFAKLDKNEAKIEKINDSTINIKIPLDNIRSPFIEFSLIKREKNDNEKYSELLNIVQHLNNRINFLENLLKAKNNKDYKKGLESFKGTVIEMTCFGRNEIDNYFDLKQEYALKKKDEMFPKFFSIVLKCKDNNDIPLIVESFYKMKDNYLEKDNLFLRVNNNKLYGEIHINNEDDPFDHLDDPSNDRFQFYPLCFSSGQSLIIKTEAIPRDMFEEYNEEKILNFILGIEVEFSNLSPQIQLFALFFQEISQKKGFFEYIFKDIYMNLINGNYKYKVEKSLFEGEKNVNNKSQLIREIYNGLKEMINYFAFGILQVDKFKEYTKIDFDEIEINIISSKYKAGFNFKFTVPKSNELIDDIIKGKIKINQQ